MKNIYKDLSTITNIGEYNFTKLIKNIELLIAHYIDEAKKENKRKIKIDLGIGELTILLKENLEFLFQPSDRLIKISNKTLEGKLNPLADAIGKEIKIRLESVYKELM